MVSKEVYEYAVKKNKEFKKRHGVSNIAYDSVIREYKLRIKRENKNY